MKILFLNTDNASKEVELSNYLQPIANKIDVFCFQEFFTKVENILPKEIIQFPRYSTEKKLKEDYLKIATIAKNRNTNSYCLPIMEDEVGIFTVTEFTKNKELPVIINVHGNPRPSNKLDCDIRVSQTKQIVKEIEKYKNRKIVIGGDFNLDINTKSINMFEELGFVNLIKKHKISTTRSNYAWEKFKDFPKQYFADYVLVSPNINVKNFTVENVEISDHLPMILEI